MALVIRINLCQRLALVSLLAASMALIVELVGYS